MEPIIVYRAVTEDDAYGDPKPVGPVSSWPVWNTFQGMFGPSNPSEPLEVGDNKVISGGEVYIRGVVPTGILASDAVGIRGRRFLVDGEVGSWSGYDGYRGDQFAVKAAS